MCRVLDACGASDSHVLVVTDVSSDVDKHQADFHNLSVKGFSGNRIAFVWCALSTVFKRKPTLLLIGHVHYAPLGLLLKMIRPTLRYGVMVHGTEVWLRLPTIRRFALRHAAFIASVSDYTKRQLISVNGVKASKIYVVPDTLEWKWLEDELEGTKRQEQN